MAEKAGKDCDKRENKTIFMYNVNNKTRNLQKIENLFYLSFVYIYIL